MVKKFVYNLKAYIHPFSKKNFYNIYDKYSHKENMKKIIIILLILFFSSSQVSALIYCRYDYNDNRICRSIPPEEIHAAKYVRHVDMYDERGRKVSLRLKTYKNIVRVINSRRAYIGSGFEDSRGNIHILENGHIVKTFYVRKR